MLNTFLVNLFAIVTLLDIFSILWTGTNGLWGDLAMVAIYPGPCKGTSFWTNILYGP